MKALLRSSSNITSSGSYSGRSDTRRFVTSSAMRSISTCAMRAAKCGSAKMSADVYAVATGTSHATQRSSIARATGRLSKSTAASKSVRVSSA